MQKGVYEIVSLDHLRRLFKNEKELELALNGTCTKAVRAQPEKDKPKPFSILILDRKDFDKTTYNERLPKAHTCFNRLDLPDYDDYVKFREKMNYCLCNTIGFGTE